MLINLNILLKVYMSLSKFGTILTKESFLQIGSILAIPLAFSKLTF